MIDINLLGKKPKTKPEGPSILSQLSRTKAGIFGGSAVLLLGLFWIFGDTIVGMMYTSPAPSVNTQQARLDSLKRALAERPLATQQEQPIIQEPEPVQEPEPKPVELPWDYGLSITHIEAFTTLIHALPQTTDYNIIVISRNGIVAELIEVDADVLVELQSTISNALPGYTFDFRPMESTLQIWGNRKNDMSMTDVSPSPDYSYSTPDANLSALNAISQESNVTISERGNTVPTVRDNISLLPIWIKLQGTETNILRYLDSIRTKRLNLNITKISSSGLHRNLNGESSVLNFHFEILM